MPRLDKQTLKSRLLRLAKLKSTGTPADLAYRFNISERSVKRIVKELRDEGIVIRFSPSCISYLIMENSEKIAEYVV